MSASIIDMMRHVHTQITYTERTKTFIILITNETAHHTKSTVRIANTMDDNLNCVKINAVETFAIDLRIDFLVWNWHRLSTLFTKTE